MACAPSVSKSGAISFELLELHRKFVARQPRLVCGRAPSDPHHLRFAQQRSQRRVHRSAVIAPTIASSTARVMRRLGGTELRSNRCR